MWLLFCFNRFFHNQVSNGPFTFSTPRPPFVHDAFWIWLKQVILILYLSLSPNIYIFFVKPVFFWCILSVFSLGVPCFHQHDGPKPRLQAAAGCEVVLNDRCVIALGEGVRLQVRVSRILRWRAENQADWRGDDVKKIPEYYVSFWFMRTCTNVYSSHVHFKICIVCGCVSESRAPPSALYMNLGRTPPDSVGFWLLRLGHLLFEDGWQVQWYLYESIPESWSKSIDS